MNNSKNNLKGSLYVCGTPIGNLDDMTYRSVKTLKDVDLIVAEDTRNTIKILNHFDINTKMTSYHEHNKHEKGKRIIELLKCGNDIAIVTDAGMPCISDPGEDLVKLCYENNITVTTVPTGTAVVSALILSGLNMKTYSFLGFLPRDKKIRKQILESLKTETKTTVLYESPHHLKTTLKDLKNVIDDRQVSVVREITKKFEENITGSIDFIIEHFNTKDPKGEICIVINGTTYKQLKEEDVHKWNKISIEEHMNIYLKENFSEKESMKLVAKDRNVSKREIYAYLNK